MRSLTEGVANDQLLYFTSPSLTIDWRTLVFISDRDGEDRPNLFALDRDSGKITRLTSNDAGRLRSYVYFNGNDRRGLGLASPSLHAATGMLYWIQGREICSVNVYDAGTPRVIGEVAESEMTAFTHVSDDGTRLCLPTIDRRAFDHDGRSESYDRVVQELGLASHIRVYDTTTGQLVMDRLVERGWVTHVQFRPSRPDQILFNHEYCSSSGARRMWLLDSDDIRPLREVGKGSLRSPDDWVCHEIWTHDGNHVLYHGQYANGPAFVGRICPDDDAQPIEIAFPETFKRYGHFTASPADNRLVTDGYFEAPGGSDQGWGGNWISVVSPDWAARTLDWRPLCRHGSSWNSQDAHPHPVFSHDAKEVLFTSDTDGKRQIFSARC